MTIKASDILTEEAVRQRLEEIIQEDLQFRRAFRSLDATGINNNTFKIPKPDDTIGEPEAIPEGSEFPRDEESYSKVTVDFDKYGFETAITMESMADSMLDLAADNIDRQARQMDEFLNRTAYAELDANLHSESPAGGESDDDQALEFADFVDAKTIMRRDGYDPSIAIVNSYAEKDLLTSDDFLRATDMGDDTVQEAQLGRTAGLDVFVDNHGLMDDTDAEAYVIDPSFYGYEAVRQDIQTNQYEAEERQAEIMQIWTRRGFKTMDPDAAIKVTPDGS